MGLIGSIAEGWEITGLIKRGYRVTKIIIASEWSTKKNALLYNSAFFYFTRL